jgi:hypothetical protein
MFYLGIASGLHHISRRGLCRTKLCVVILLAYTCVRKPQPCIDPQAVPPSHFGEASQRTFIISEGFGSFAHSLPCLFGYVPIECALFLPFVPSWSDSRVVAPLVTIPPSMVRPTTDRGPQTPGVSPT